MLELKKCIKITQMLQNYPNGIKTQTNAYMTKS